MVTGFDIGVRKENKSKRRKRKVKFEGGDVCVWW